MARARSICKRNGCPQIATRNGFCEKDAAEMDARRGTTTQRGYGSEHQRERLKLLPTSYGKPCPLCGRTMLRGHRLALHHSTPLAVDPNAKGDQITHTACNEAASKTTGLLDPSKPLPAITWYGR